VFVNKFDEIQPRVFLFDNYLPKYTTLKIIILGTIVDVKKFMLIEKLLDIFY